MTVIACTLLEMAGDSRITGDVIHHVEKVRRIKGSIYGVAGDWDAGCLIDEKAYAFAYGKNSARKPMIGVGLVDKGIPHFIPMKQKDGRWTGEM